MSSPSHWRSPLRSGWYNVWREIGKHPVSIFWISSCAASFSTLIVFLQKFLGFAFVLYCCRQAAHHVRIEGRYSQNFSCCINQFFAIKTSDPPSFDGKCWRWPGCHSASQSDHVRISAVVRCCGFRNGSILWFLRASDYKRLYYVYNIEFLSPTFILERQNDQRNSQQP